MSAGGRRFTTLMDRHPREQRNGPAGAWLSGRPAKSLAPGEDSGSPTFGSEGVLEVRQPRGIFIADEGFLPIAPESNS